MLVSVKLHEHLIWTCCTTADTMSMNFWVLPSSCKYVPEKSYNTVLLITNVWYTTYHPCHTFSHWLQSELKECSCGFSSCKTRWQSDSVHLYFHSTTNREVVQNIKKMTGTYQAVLFPPQHHCCFWTKLCWLLWQQCCSLCQKWCQSAGPSAHSLTGFLCHGRYYCSSWYQCRTPVGRIHCTWACSWLRQVHL